MTDITEHAVVVGVSPDLIHIEVEAGDAYRDLDRHVEIGSYLKISDDDGASVIAVVQSYRIKDQAPASTDEASDTPTFVLQTQSVGHIRDGKFRRGGKQITIPPTHVEIASTTVLEEIYSSINADAPLSFGALAQDNSVRVVVDGDRFFGKHIGVVGSTGSGKSCTVARILQEGIKPSSEQSKAGVLNNSHVIIFDLHGEYATAFPRARVIGVDNLKLPYWLMDSEELEEMFIESNEENSHNQISQFRQAVIENKQRHANLKTSISYDSPVYFSLNEVINYLTNLNNEVVGKLDGEGVPKLKDNILVKSRSAHYFDQQHEFVLNSNAKDSKAVNGPFYGELDRFLMRLGGRRNDTRLDFLLSPTKDDGSEYRTEDLGALLQQITGYGNEKTNVTIIDLSGIPFEVLSVVVSLMSRLIFSFAFYLRKGKQDSDRDLPFLLVYEEAHNYVPRRDAARYRSVKRAIERIAKEGRKYGISLMIVSQRPAEISETVFSQCSNFVAMRLTNPSDQQYVKRLLPDTLNAITEALPTLEQREAIVIGDSITVPSLVRVDDIVHLPDSHDVEFLKEWQRDWLDVVIDDTLERWRT
jgi:DNA helicase HerA-like ATPase